MSLSVGCPRCAAPVTETAVPAGRASSTPRSQPLWRPGEAAYDAFADHLRRSASVPTYLPWPLSPGWSVSDFAAVGRRARAGPAPR